MPTTFNFNRRSCSSFNYKAIIPPVETTAGPSLAQASRLCLKLNCLFLGHEQEVQIW